MRVQPPYGETCVAVFLCAEGCYEKRRPARGRQNAAPFLKTPAAAGLTEAKTGTEGIDPELLAKVLANPEMAALLTTLARNLK